MLTLIFLLIVFPVVNADIIFPTVTEVYFEQEGQPYDGKIEFAVYGYGYSTGIPGSSDFVFNKTPGTYTPEVVFGFSAVYNNYGDKIYENYYRNYRQIDYYELEGKTEDGRTFIIRNIDKIPTKDEDLDQYNHVIGGIYYKDTEESDKCIDEYPEGKVGALDYCAELFQVVEKEDLLVDDNGRHIEILSELRFDLSDAEWDGDEDEEESDDKGEDEDEDNDEDEIQKSQSKGFWDNVKCFFKRLFFVSC